MRSTGLAIALALLLACSEDAGPNLKVERALDAGSSFTAYLVSYRHTGLKLHAMVAVPRMPMPANGYPVVIANHGFVPEPRKYGITADGRDSRPGDYYRSVPELYASRGFLVIMPDYRGHNTSEGFEQIEGQNRESVSLYADDVTALIALLGEIESVDEEMVFMWSHSMGGAVSMRALLATNTVKASSFWSTMNVDDLVDRLSDLAGPVLVQHATGDASTPYSSSVALAEALAAAGHPFQLHGYESAEHYFSGALREQAADRDAEFFRRAVTP